LSSDLIICTIEEVSSLSCAESLNHGISISTGISRVYSKSFIKEQYIIGIIGTITIRKRIITTENQTIFGAERENYTKTDTAETGAIIGKNTMVTDSSRNMIIGSISKQEALLHMDIHLAAVDPITIQVQEKL